jgi:hypothetical protein
MKNRLSAGLVFVFLGMLIVAGALLGAMRSINAWSWPAVEGRVSAVRIEPELAGSPAPDGSGGVVGYRLYTTYAYQVGMQSYTYRRMGAFFTTQAEAQQYQPEEQVGTVRMLYVNPENPLEVLLERSISGSLVGSMLGGLIAVGGAYWFFRPILRKRRSATPRSSRRR